MRTSQEAIRYLASIPPINQGGCLVAAYALYLHSKKFDRHRNFQIVQLDNLRIVYSHNKNYLDGFEDEAEPANHFGWTLSKGKVIKDALGRVKIPRKCKVLLIPHEFTDKFCLSALNNFGWNHKFKRKEWIPQIEENLGIDLSQVRL